MPIVREEERNIEDFETGKIFSEKKTVTISKTKSEKFAMLFMTSMVPYLSKLGDAATVFFCLTECMDEFNIADVSASKKKSIIIDSIYNSEGRKVNPNDNKIKNQASRRFSQLVTQLAKNDLIEKIDSCRYRINPFLLAYGYNKTKGIEEMRKEYLEATTVMDLKTGETKLKIKTYYEGEDAPHSEGLDINRNSEG